MRQIATIGSLTLAMTALPALGNELIYYGSRIGMQVTIISKSGIDTAQAVIRTKHTRENAITFCREYVGRVTERCIRDALATPLRDAITANCRTGHFTNFWGERMQFEGPNRRSSGGNAKFVIRKLETGEILDGSSASGYGTSLGAFSALCPASVQASKPKDDELSKFIGLWSHIDEKCKSARAQTEGTYFRIMRNRFEGIAGSRCRNVRMRVQGDSITITGMCTAEDSGYM